MYGSEKVNKCWPNVGQKSVTLAEQTSESEAHRRQNLTLIPALKE